MLRSLRELSVPDAKCSASERMYFAFCRDSPAPRRLPSLSSRIAAGVTRPRGQRALSRFCTAAAALIDTCCCRIEPTNATKELGVITGRCGPIFLISAPRRGLARVRWRTAARAVASRCAARLSLVEAVIADAVACGFMRSSAGPVTVGSGEPAGTVEPGSSAACAAGRGGPRAKRPNPGATPIHFPKPASATILMRSRRGTSPGGW